MEFCPWCLPTSQGHLQVRRGGASRSPPEEQGLGVPAGLTLGPRALVTPGLFSFQLLSEPEESLLQILQTPMPVELWGFHT